MCRHTMTFRAVDESIRKYVEADTLPTLCDALLDWPDGAKSYGDLPEVAPNDAVGAMHQAQAAIAAAQPARAAATPESDGDM